MDYQLGRDMEEKAAALKTYCLNININTSMRTIQKVICQTFFNEHSSLKKRIYQITKKGEINKISDVISQFQDLIEMTNINYFSQEQRFLIDDSGNGKVLQNMIDENYNNINNLQKLVYEMLRQFSKQSKINSTSTSTEKIKLKRAYELANELFKDDLPQVTFKCCDPDPEGKTPLKIYEIQISYDNKFHLVLEFECDEYMKNNSKVDQVIVWLDKNIDSEENKDYVETLRKEIPDHQILTFTSWDELKQKMNSYFVVNMIISGSEGKALKEEIQSSFEFNSILVFCWNKALHQEWAKDVKQVCILSNNFNEILEQLKIQLGSKIYPMITLEKLKTILKKNNLNFYLSQFSENYLNKLNKKEILKSISDTVQKFHIKVQDTFVKELNNKNDELSDDISSHFNSIQSLIKLYTLEKYPRFYVIINKILWSLNEEAIMSFAPFIKTLSYSISSYEDKLTDFSPNFKVYRGLNSDVEDFLKKFKVGDDIVMTGFTSTSLDINVALDFANEKILLIIEFDAESFGSDLSSKRGKEISQVSYYKNENEVLFKCFSCFKIIEISSKDPIQVKLRFFLPNFGENTIGSKLKMKLKGFFS